MQSKHFLTIEHLDQKTLIALLNQAQTFSETEKTCDRLQHKVVTNLFFETSTRTRFSFELAAKRLGATVLNFDPKTSSTQKGETLLDTVKTVTAMGVHILVIRHEENHLAATLAQSLDDVSIINAGDGTHEHPTQALLDMLTIRQHKPNFSQLKVAIMGDIRHSRVAHSAIHALHCLGVPDIRVIAPDLLMPQDPNKLRVRTFTQPEQGLQDVDVVMTLRLQKERMQAAHIPDGANYFQHYGLTSERLRFAKPDAIVMHPGPMNRDVEIASSVADGPQSVILQQVRNGVAARMAVMAWCLDT